MYIEAKQLDSQNKFLNDYQQQNNWLLNQFDYNPYAEDTYKHRSSDLKERSFNRDELADTLMKLNKSWSASEQTILNIEKLRDENSVVVIGGQQAGILSGPLYTIHKIISILTFAHTQEKELGIPVLPVFWIAGEDHDFDEVNHVYLPKTTTFKKKTLHDMYEEKVSVSNRMINKEDAFLWLKEVFGELKETSYTYDIWSVVKKSLTESETVVDFFASFIHTLFEETGLILIDSGNEHVRKLESTMFEQLISKQPDISTGVYRSLQSMRTKGYAISVDTEEEDGHIFIEENGERVLLKKEHGKWVGKNDECSYTTEELLAVAREQPERLSNNVVTRPIMQEMLFPTLAFFAGPSEAAYWSILKPAFHSLSLNMPPVLPRVSITFIEHKVAKLLEKYDLSLSNVLKNGVKSEKQNWLVAQNSPPIERISEQFKETIRSNHQPFKEITKNLSDDVEQYTDKNLQLILDQVNQLSNRLHKEFSNKYESHLSEFDKIELQIRPQNGIQERMWNILYFLNHYGLDTMQNIFTSNYDWKEGHYIVYM